MTIDAVATDPITRWAKDFIVLGNVPSPGKATVRKAGSPRKWTKNEAFGMSGATLIFNGDDLSEFEVEIEMWQEAQLDEWDFFVQMNLSKTKILRWADTGGPTVRALAIEHPLISGPPWSINAVVVTNVTQPEEDDYGHYHVILRLQEYRAPVKAGGKAIPAIPGNPDTVVAAQDARDVAIQQLNDQIANAKAGL